MISENRRAQLLWCWENEVEPEDEKWRDELTEEEQELVDSWDGAYASGIEKLISEL